MAEPTSPQTPEVARAAELTADDPLTVHVEVFENAHRRLQEILSEADR